MRAAIVTTTGAPPQAGDFDDPTASDGNAVATVRVAGLNPVDLYKASGEFGDVPLPSVAGSEGVADLDGRRVYFADAVAPFGSMAERTLIDPAEAFDVPDGLDDDAAVTLGIAGLAAWLPLCHHAPLQGGERVLVLGATGIAGQLAVQAAKLLGAGTVVAAGRDAETLAPLRERGADAIAVLDDDDPGAALADAAGDGFDVVADYVYGAPGQAALEQTKPGASHVVVGGGAGQEASLPFRDLQGRRVIGHANWFVPLGVRREAYTSMAEHWIAGRLSVEIQRFALDDVGEAWETQASSPHRKLVVVP
jgi:NADPH:quinone reductase-like Zn-dependent oxidoreductase